MREYETVFVVQPEISDEGRQGLYEKFDGVLQRAGSDRLLYDDMGKRKLAYEIRKFQKGHYVVLRYLDAGQVVPELERAMRLDDSILRYMTVVVEDEVADIAARKAQAAEEERIAAERAAERAAREAEEEKARREAEAVRRAEEAERAEAAAEAKAAADKAAADAAPEETPDADAPEATAEDAAAEAATEDPAEEKPVEAKPAEGAEG